MPDTVPLFSSAASPSNSAWVGPRKTGAILVLLLACEPRAALDGLAERLAAFAACGCVRILVRGDCPQALEAGRLAVASGTWPVELVLAPGLPRPEPKDGYARVLAMPASTAQQDLDDLVLAFSDALLWFGVDDGAFAVRARALGKSEQPEPDRMSVARSPHDLGDSLLHAFARAQKERDA